jgi:hypothetical protein
MGVCLLEFQVSGSRNVQRVTIGRHARLRLPATKSGEKWGLIPFSGLGLSDHRKEPKK